MPFIPRSEALKRLRQQMAIKNLSSAQVLAQVSRLNFPKKVV